MNNFEKPDAMKFSQSLLDWWEKNKREYPWRLTRDPYRILVSELLLHRTRADQVMPVYQKFIERFPSLTKLSNATEKEITEILLPLGLYWRSTLLLRMVKSIINENGGRIPSSRTELEHLPGIGPYISSATICFAYNYPEVLLDTNTVRIFGRVIGIRITDGSRRSKCFRLFAKYFLNKDKPRDFNYALIDLGALVCLSKKPLCEICPLVTFCKYANS
jgi:A/G-specific adenine glycosylase